MKGPFELCHPGHWIQGREPRQMILTNIARLLLPSCASLVVQRLKCLPAMWETWVQSLGQEDPLEKETATHSSILPGESHGRRSLVGCSPRGRKEWDTTERHHFHFHFAPVRPELYNNVGVPGGVDGKNLPALQETRV